MFKILDKKLLAPSIYMMEVEAPRLASAAKPGQFLVVRDDEKGERVPLTISDFDASKGSVEMVIQTIGASTMKMCEKEPGDAFADVLGPLGCPSEFTAMSDEQLKSTRFLFIAGGVGAAPVYPQAKYLFQRGARVDVIMGAKSAGMLTYEEKMSKVCDNLFICTDDGSKGFHGLVTAKAKELVAEGRVYDQAVAIGPMIMMKFAALTLKELAIPLTVSLNTLMVDATGMCGACRVTVGGRTRFACVEGPEFNAYEVDFDEAMRRQTMYRDIEGHDREDYIEHHKCNIR